ncbi:PREDICTED: protein lethal(2)essential for life-like [Dufourea novaeangliae]|uniref:Protein lethal(2)essential for life n=1 Tax=Dufourea novaeangliae TaxID=178035 RepID=A0A154PDX2_DUFNO|nr:PREDICTED: protein lethal(2)essential for life-like [Dufourea novaeangliae]KZC10007.1 Protein lethal(2)essential for life [Dufourea novaeangliae]
MSLIPMLFSNWWEDLDHPHRLFDQNFGRGLHPEQLLSPSRIEQYEHLWPPIMDRRVTARDPSLLYYRPWRKLLHKEGGTSTVQADKNKFHVVLDIPQFKPEEINVKVVDKCVIVEGKHEEKKDEHGWISRQFTRKYLIPEQCDIEQVSSSLSSDGVLSITAPRKHQPKVQAERTITIEHTGKPAIKKAPEEQKEKEEEKKEEK